MLVLRRHELHLSPKSIRRQGTIKKDFPSLGLSCTDKIKEGCYYTDTVHTDLPTLLQHCAQSETVLGDYVGTDR